MADEEKERESSDSILLKNLENLTKVRKIPTGTGDTLTRGQEN